MTRSDEFANRRLELNDAAMDAPPQLFVREFGEPALHMYSPTMSRTFSMSSGSVDSLNVSVRCGCNPNASYFTFFAVRTLTG
jgi:hypothetical protein